MTKKVNVSVNYIPLEQLSKHPQNPRSITEADLLALCDSIREDPLYFETRPIICSNRTGKLVIIAGEKRFIAAGRLELMEVPVAVIPGLSDTDEIRILFKDNGSFGEWDWQLVKDYGFSNLALSTWGVDMAEDFQEENTWESKTETQENAKKSLRDKFIIPPFSILDTRQGYWQDRKRKWIDLGIKSEESRENMEVTGTFSGSVPGYYKLKEDTQNKTGRQLTNKEFEETFLPEILEKRSSNLAYTESGGVLSIFDPVLCEIIYYWFCPSGGKIFDPFAGGSVRGIVAGFLDYEYCGIDLRPEQVEANIKQKEELTPSAKIAWIAGNSLHTRTHCGGEKHDLVFSCPPYFDLEVYSDSKEDLSNLNWDEFKDQYSDIINQSVELLNDNSFACFVVGDIRDKNGFYRNFVGHTIKAFEEAGASLYNEIVLVNVAGSLPVRITRQFNSYRKVGKCHQNVLVFYKGDPKKIKEKFPDLDLSEIATE